VVEQGRRPPPADLTPRPPSLEGRGSDIREGSALPLPFREGGRGVRSAGPRERPTRLTLLLLIIGSAVLLPDISISAALPDVRVEQLVALPALIWLMADWWRERRLPRATPIDWAFAALGLSTLASIIWASFVLDGRFSLRDPYELIKLALYWTLLRFGLQTVERTGRRLPRTRRAALITLLVAGAAAGAAGVAQYFNVLALNSWLTPLWAPEHHLRTLARDARAVGTVGNPNYFGMLCTIVVLAAVTARAFCPRRSMRWPACSALVAGAAGLVTSASRGATLALVVGLCVVWLGIVLSRRSAIRPAVLATTAAVLALAAAILVVEAAPRGRVGYLARMTGSLGRDDGGLALRLERWRSVMVPWLDGDRVTAADGAAAGTPPSLNFLRNGDLERGGVHADDFRTLPGTWYELTADDALFGRRSARFRGNPSAPGQRAALFQQRYLGRPGGTPLTAQLAVKLTGPIDGDLSLYANIFYADGTRSDPHVRVSADPTRLGAWQELSAPIEPEAGRVVTFVGVYLMGEGFRGEALVDGFALHDGAAAVNFASLRESPAVLSGAAGAARLRQSPLLGVGPAKAEPAQATVTDNEYLLIVSRYGLVGLVLYLALWGSVFATMWHGLRGGARNAAAALRLTVAATVAGLLIFNLAAGSFLHLQLMALFWPLAGVAAARWPDDR
jgi:O-antigen ligase